MPTTIIGPVFPYRAGIAYCTTRLAEVLDAPVISFKRQFPKRFYPGGDDVDPTLPRFESARFLLDIVNPITWFRTALLLRREKPDAVIFVWWIWVWALPYLVMLALLPKRTRVILQCHNIGDKEPAAWKRMLTNLVLRRGDVLVVHAKTEAEDAARRLGVRLRESAPHPPSAPSPHREEAAMGRGLPNFTLRELLSLLPFAKGRRSRRGMRGRHSGDNGHSPFSASNDTAQLTPRHPEPAEPRSGLPRRAERGVRISKFATRGTGRAFRSLRFFRSHPPTRLAQNDGVVSSLSTLARSPFHARDDIKIVQTFLPVHELGGPIPSREEARHTLGLQGNVALFFGHVRPFKGLDIALRAWRELKTEVTLVVAGEAWWKGEEEYRALAQGLTNVRFDFRFIPDAEIATYFAAADVVLAPYRIEAQSGVALTAFHFARPVIATNVGGLPEIIEEGVNGMLVPPEDPSALARAIEAFFARSDRATMERHAAAAARKYSWEEYGALMKRLVAGE